MKKHHMALFLRGFLLSPHKKRSAKGAYLVYFLYNSYYYIYYTSQGLESWNPRSKHSITIGTAAIRERPEECMNPKFTKDGWQGSLNATCCARRKSNYANGKMAIDVFPL